MGRTGRGVGRRGEEGRAAPDRLAVTTSSAGHRPQVHRPMRVFCSSDCSVGRRGREMGRPQSLIQ